MKSPFSLGRKASSNASMQTAPLSQSDQAVRVQQLATLNAILTQLTGTLSPDKVLNTVIESAVKLSPAVTAVAVYLYWDDQRTTLALVRSGGLSDRFFSDPPDPLLNASARQQTLAQSMPVIVEDAAQWGLSIDSTSGAVQLRTMMTIENKKAWIELPLAVGGVGLGVMVLFCDQPTTFPADQVELLRTFATQVAQSISNARLYSITDEALERRVGQLLALAAIGHELTATIDIEQICTLVLNHALDATNSKVGAVLLLDERGRIDRLITRGYPDHAFDNPMRAFTGITKRVIASGKAVLARNALAEPDFALIHPYVRSQLSVPIMHGITVMGAITLESEAINAYNEEDSHFIAQLTNQTVIAIDNARLFTRIAEALYRLQVILNAMQEALILIDKDGMVTLANPAVQNLGFAPDQLLNQSVEDLLESRDLDLAHRFGFASENELRRITKEVRTPDAWLERAPVTYTLELSSGTRRFQRQVIAVPGADGLPIGALLVFYDETEQFKLEQTREDLGRMLIHDLRSPLTAVTTSLKLLTELVPQEASFRPAVESTTDAGRRAIRKLLARVDSLLDVSRMENGFIAIDAKPTELAGLVENVITELSPLAKELNVSVQAVQVADAPLLHIDADKVERILLNLLDNALKFSPLDSRVMIRAALDATDGFLRVEVVDSGAGVPDDYKTRLFDRFVQVQGRTGSRRGSGLGLTFCRLVTEAHGGRIWIEDNPGGGSIFAFTLPLARAPLASSSAAAETAPPML
ncbi:MAG: GAF domain-containing protein [bacterium]|nr:GAF domain-containing protein [bacterium]